MTSDIPPDKAGRGLGSESAARTPNRFAGGPRAIGKLVASVTRPAFQARSAAIAQMMADWPEIVGASLAETTFPTRLVSGTLTLSCTGPVALELQHLTGALAERINAHYGRVVVERFRFVQSHAPSGTVAARARRRTRPVPIEIPDMPPGELRDALAALGAAVRQPRRRDGA